MSPKLGSYERGSQKNSEIIKLEELYFIKFYKFYKIKFTKIVVQRKLFTIQMELNTENLYFNNPEEGRGKQIIPQTIKTFCEHGGTLSQTRRLLLFSYGLSTAIYFI